MTQVGIAKGFKADLAELPGPIARKALVWLTDYMTNPDDARLEAHRIERSLMPNLWTAKLDDSYRVIYRLDQDGVRHLLLCDTHDRAYRRAEKPSRERGRGGRGRRGRSPRGLAASGAPEPGRRATPTGTQLHGLD